MKDLKYFDAHRRATWLELFFDLIFVVALSDAGEILSETHDGHIALGQFLHFVLVLHAEPARSNALQGKATVHGKGLAIGIEVEDEAYASQIGDRCRKSGLLVSAEEDVLMLFPALTITHDTAERGLDIFEEAI